MDFEKLKQQLIIDKTLLKSQIHNTEHYADKLPMISLLGAMEMQLDILNSLILSSVKNIFDDGH